SGFAGSLGAARGGVARHVAEPGMPEQVVPVGMGGEPGDHWDAEPVHVIGELVELGTVDAGVDQDQPALPTHHDGVAPDPLALPPPDPGRPPVQALCTPQSKSLRLTPARPGSAISCFAITVMLWNLSVERATGKLQFHAEPVVRFGGTLTASAILRPDA